VEIAIAGDVTALGAAVENTFHDLKIALVFE
jgi:hypothetical protein